MPRGGSTVNFEPFCRMDTGNFGLGILVSHKRKSRCTCLKQDGCDVIEYDGSDVFKTDVTYKKGMCEARDAMQFYRVDRAQFR